MATLRASYKSGNGRRVTHDFQIDASEVADPAKKADKISAASAYGFGRGWWIVNWKVID